MITDALQSQDQTIASKRPSTVNEMLWLLTRNQKSSGRQLLQKHDTLAAESSGKDDENRSRGDGAPELSRLVLLRSMFRLDVVPRVPLGGFRLRQNYQNEVDQETSAIGQGSARSTTYARAMLPERVELHCTRTTVRKRRG